MLWNIISIVYFAMLRKSQFANNSVQTSNPAEQFTREDFQFTDYSISVKVKWSNSKQKHTFCRFIPVARMPQSALCPVNAYSRMVSLDPALPDEPAFGLLHRGKLRPFSRKVIDKKFRLFCQLTI